MGYSMFGFFDTVFPVLFTGMFVLVMGVFLVTFIKGIGTWNKNNQSPVLTVNAKVVSRRERRSRHHNADGFDHVSTHYYVTFEVESGDRMELSVSGQEYGMLAEGDDGKLTFQGTRYQGFERQRIERSRYREQ